MSKWKLVEAEAVVDNDVSKEFVQHNKQQSGQQQQQGNNWNRGNNNNNVRRGSGGGQSNRRNSGGRDNRNGGSRNSRGHTNRRYNDIYIPDTPETRKQYATMAVQLLEYYFSDDCLSCDTFMRSYFDTAGYIPIAFVCNFPDIVAIGAYYEDIITQIKASENFEIDLDNETIRVKGWEKWLMPNGEGGFGLPRYLKQQTLEPAAAQQETVRSNTRDRSGSKELSVNASEFVSSVSPTK